jgi:hypothetical protein
VAQYQLHQDQEGSFRFGYRGGVNEDELRAALSELLGNPAKLIVEELPSTGQRKIPVYRSLHPGALRLAR